jgi:hypothetical protein
MHENILDYHPRSLRLNENGVESFFMPVSEAATDRFFADFMASIASLLRDTGIDDDPTAEAIWLSTVYLAQEATVSFISTQIAIACRKRNIRACYGDAGGMLTQIGRDEPFSSVLAARFRRRAFQPTFVRTWGRYVRSLVRGDSYSRKPPILINRKRDALCFAADPWHQRLARESGISLVLSHPENWYEGFELAFSDPATSPDRTLIEKVVALCERQFEAAGVDFPGHVRQSLLSAFELVIKVVLAMTVAGARNWRYLPNRFWATSMGPLHNRIIARQVQKRGGQVTTFDHGTGCGWMDLIELNAFEWDFSDRFVAFKGRNAEGVKSLIERGAHYRVNARCCSVEGSPIPLFDAAAVTRSKSGRPSSRLRVWYVPSHYTQEQYYAPPLPPDMVAVDFQVRLLRHLSELGHDVVVKPHPGCTIGFPPSLVQSVGARVETRPFEAAVSEADVVMLDYPQSTTFRSSMISGVPLVVLDPGRVAFTPEAMELLKKRAAVVPIRRSDDNRRHVEKSDLAAAITQAMALNDSEFQRTYYPAS